MKNVKCMIGLHKWTRSDATKNGIVFKGCGRMGCDATKIRKDGKWKSVSLKEFIELASKK